MFLLDLVNCENPTYIHILQNNCICKNSLSNFIRDIHKTIFMIFITTVTVKNSLSLITHNRHGVIYFSHSNFRFWYRNTLVLSIKQVDPKGGSRLKNWCMARVLSFLIRYFSNYYTLHRSDLAAQAALGSHGTFDICILDMP